MKKLLLFLLCGFISVQSIAQLSNSQIMKIKEDAEDGKTLWLKLLEDSYNQKNMSELPALRKANEDFLNEHISKLSRMYAEGDGRELIVAVKNYLTIEKQFVKDVMIPAESMKPGDEEAYDQINREIADFTRKERAFELDISNALRTSPEPMTMDEPAESNEPEEELSEEEIKQREEAKPRRKEKLPHETYNKGGKKKKNRNQQDEYED